MPATTSAINACDAAIAIDNAAGVLVDISGAANRAALEFTQTVESYRVFGERWIRRLACGKDATLRLDLVYTTTANEALDLLRDWFFASGSAAPRTVRIAVAGTIGSDAYEGEFVLARLNLPLDASNAAPILVTADLLPHGVVSYTTI
ncbi:MAG: hypothetical protein SGJ24_18955 [Chloroflexota bacterium]|nr:hypothetical protein [Chloroflexota bacterium]